MKFDITDFFDPSPEPPNPLGLKTGQKVTHKSGGLVMIVTGISYSGQVRCEWFDANSMRRARFNPESIRPAANKAKDKPSKSHKNP